MTTSKRLSERKVAKFQKNITNRGLVPETTSKKGYDYPVGPIVLGFFVFVVIGSYNKDSFKRWDGLSKSRRKFGVRWDGLSKSRGKFGVIWTSSKTSVVFKKIMMKDEKQNKKQQPAAHNSQHYTSNST
ncbi:stress-associated endoplasmic reticulum protein 2 [Quercus suber]|uniref:Stress-associated endoplasmic reticulum protein 2 n=1 Tax=Quercus suber TaxID=58331 RepID=A0AAW0L0H1_QUESU